MTREQSEELLARIQLGDGTALEALYRTWYRALWDFAFRYLRCAAAAEDVVHDVFASLWIRRERLNLRVSLDAYLFGAVRNAAIQRVRHEYVERAAVVQESAHLLAMGAPPPLPDTAVIQRDRSELVSAALANLSPSQREVLILHWYHGLAYVEIARDFHVTAQAARQQGSRAQRALRALLEGMESSGSD
jgi:RNA polymerase sigma factor (sigma-70 family)